MKKLLNLNIVSVALLYLIVAGCSKDSTVDPKIETMSAAATSASTFMVTGDVIETGSFPIVNYGIAFSQNDYVDTTGYKINLGSSPKKGTFQTEVSPPFSGYYNQGSPWYVRTYLTNKKGTVYGKILSVTFPVITVSSVVPLSGKVGDQITITGTNFSTTPSSNIVMFNNTQATVVSATSTQLVVAIPSGIASSYYYGSAITISIKTFGGTVSATQNFYLLPTITGFTPQNGTFGTLVTITGSDFNTSSYYTTVYVGSASVNATSASSNAITFTIPQNVTTDKLQISVAVGNGYGGSTIVNVPGQFTINPPIISSISPSTGIGGTVVTVNGQNFNSGSYYNNYNTVTIGGVNATIQSSSSNQIKFSVPTSLNKGNYNISVFTGVHTVTSTDAFTLASPQITDFQPQSAIRGTYVTINGSNFGSYDYYNGASVLFGTTQVTIYSWSETSIKVYLPTNMPTGSMQITVNSGGQSVTSANSFTVN